MSDIPEARFCDLDYWQWVNQKFLIQQVNVGPFRDQTLVLSLLAFLDSYGYSHQVVFVDKVV